MRTSVKMAIATGALAVAGGLFLAGSGLAQSGPGGAGHMGPMGGPMGGFGELRREMMKDIDTNNDGALSQDEINAAINSRFAEFDADKNGSLSLQEFEALWAEITKPIAVRTFQFLDPNGDAAIAKSELDDRFGGIVARFDRNGDGMLSSADHPRHGPRDGWRPWRHGQGARHHMWRDQGPGDQGPGDGDQGSGGDDDQ